MKRSKKFAAAALALSLIAAPTAQSGIFSEDMSFGITAAAADDWSSKTDEEKVDAAMASIGSGSYWDWSEYDEDYLYENTDELFWDIIQSLWTVAGSHDEVGFMIDSREVSEGDRWGWSYNDSSSGLSYYWVNIVLRCGNVYKNMNVYVGVKTSIQREPEPEPAPVVSYYSVSLSGDYAGSGIKVSGYSNTAGLTVTVDVPVGYTVDVISGSGKIACISDGRGSFVMPAGNVTLKVTSYLSALSGGYKNAYIYSYDSSMNHIKTNSARGGMKAAEDDVTVKLGSDYAGKSVTLYTGRKSTASKVDEAVLDKSGRAVFTVKSGKNYTLVVED